LYFHSLIAGFSLLVFENKAIYVPEIIVDGMLRGTVERRGRTCCKRHFNSLISE
jgi:hypothetical protein